MLKLWGHSLIRYNFKIIFKIYMYDLLRTLQYTNLSTMELINCRTKYWRPIRPMLHYTRRLNPKLMRIREILYRSTTKGLQSSTLWRIHSWCTKGLSKPWSMYCELYPLISNSNLTFYVIFHKSYSNLV